MRQNKAKQMITDKMIGTPKPKESVKAVPLKKSNGLRLLQLNVSVVGPVA